VAERVITQNNFFQAAENLCFLDDGIGTRRRRPVSFKKLRNLYSEPNLEKIPKLVEKGGGYVKASQSKHVKI
jgi:hypothetical protein